MTNALPGGPGDNYSFVWNLWWMRHWLATPGLAYFHTNFLFYPFGTTIADHPHTALPALIAATLLGGVSVVTAQNLLLLGYVFANMAVMYALAWDITRHRRASVLAAVLFGLSPYLAVHPLGHFDLVAAWVLPAFAVALHRAVRGSNAAAFVAGLVLAATAYIAYYYVVYEGFFAVIYLAAGAGRVALTRASQPQPVVVRAIRVLCLAGGAVSAAVAAAIVMSGGRTFDRPYQHRLRTGSESAARALSDRRTISGVLRACILVLALAAAASIQDQAPTAKPFKISAHRYAFVPARIEVNQDDLVKIELSTDDIAHSLTIDDYRIAKRVGPGQPVTFEFRADHAGTFPFYCNLQIEDGCRQMRGVLVVKPRP